MTKRFLNHYHCSACDRTWAESWDHMVNDRCSCGREIKPYKSEDINLDDFPDEKEKSGPERSDLRKQAEDLIIDGHIDDIREWALRDTESLEAWLRNVLCIDNLTLERLLDDFRPYLDADEEFLEELEKEIHGEKEESRQQGQQTLLG